MIIKPWESLSVGGIFVFMVGPRGGGGRWTWAAPELYLPRFALTSVSFIYASGLG